MTTTKLDKFEGKTMPLIKGLLIYVSVSILVLFLVALAAPLLFNSSKFTLPVYPNATNIRTSKYVFCADPDDPPGCGMQDLEFDTADNCSQVYEFYERELTSQGWWQVQTNRYMDGYNREYTYSEPSYSVARVGVSCKKVTFICDVCLDVDYQPVK